MSRFAKYLSCLASQDYPPKLNAKAIKRRRMKPPDTLERKFFKFWFPVLLYFVIIFYVSSLPDLRVSFKGLSFDKLFHLLEYSVAGFLLARAFHNTREGLSKRMIVWGVVLFCFFYGLSDEFHQTFVAGRSASWGDLLMDTFGGLVGGLSYQSSHRIKKFSRDGMP